MSVMGAQNKHWDGGGGGGGGGGWWGELYPV